jgi:hypothetical protein
MSFNTSKSTPSSKCIYVDNDWQAMRQQGLLAYSNLGDALNAWDSNGEATKRFGYPSATAPATIILGAGIIPCGQTEPGGTPYVNNDYVHIIGQGVDVTILTNTVSSNGGIINFQPAALHNIITNLTIKCGTSCSYGIYWTLGTNWTGLLNNVKVTGTPSNQFVTFASTNFRGTFENCIFDFSSYTGSSNPFQLGNNNSGTIRSCSFIASSSCPTAFYTAGNDGFYCTGCTFSGSPTGELVKIDGFTSNGRFVGCIFEAFTGKCVTVTLTSTPEVTFEACNFFTYGDVALSLGATKLTKIINCQIETASSNKDAILLTAGSTGCIIFGCRIIGQGTGKAINSVSTMAAEISHCTLRKPFHSNTPQNGLSISSNIQNQIWNPNNVEIDSYTSNNNNDFPLGGLVSWWKLDEPDSWIRKDSYGQNHLTPNNGGPVPNFDASLTNTVTARFFSGTAQMLSKSGNGSLQVGDIDYTITCWVRTQAINTQYPRFVVKGASDSTYEYILYHYGPGDGVYFDVGVGDGTRVATAGGASLPSNQWNFLVAWHDSVADTVNVQVNNGSVISVHYSGVAAVPKNGPFFIGGDYQGTGLSIGVFSGDMGDVGFYKRVLSSTERSALYNGGNGRSIPL